MSCFKVAKTFCIDWDQPQKSVNVVTTEGNEFVFTPLCNSFYTYLRVNSANRADGAGGHNMVSTVNKNESLYSQREIAKAEEAKEFLGWIGYQRDWNGQLSINVTRYHSCPLHLWA